MTVSDSWYAGPVARSVVLAVLAFVLASARDADAKERVHLDFESTPESRSCGGAEVLRAKVAERLGRDPFTEDEVASLRLRIAFARKRAAWTADVSLVDAEGARVGARVLDHEGSTCDPLVASVVFTVAVLLEDLAPRPAEPADPPPPEPMPEPSEPPPAPKEKPREPLPSPVRLDVSLAGAGALGGAPVSALGGEASVGLDVARVRVELAGRAYLPASSGGDVAVRTSLVHGRLAPCYGWLVASACGVFALGSISAEAVGQGVAASRSEDRLYAAVGVGALSRAFVVTDVLFVRASIDLLLSLARARFDVGDRRVWTVPAIGASATVGLGARLP